MFLRRVHILGICCLGLGLCQSATAQTPHQKPPQSRKKPAATLRAPEAMPVRTPAPWMVTVAHLINLSEVHTALQGQGIEISSPDAVAIPKVQVLNITTGMVMDNQGHILARLVNVNPEHPPNLTVFTTDHRELPARLIGLDGVTGLAVLQVDGLTIEPPLTTNAPLALKPEQQVHVWMPTFEKTLKNAKDPSSRLLNVPQVRVSTARVLTVSPMRMELTLDLPAMAESEVSEGIVLGEEHRVLGLAKSSTRHRLLVLPISAVKQALARVLKYGKSVPRGWLGIGGKDLALLSDEEREKRHVLLKQGLLIDTVLPQSPAEKAGVKVQDIVEEIEGHPLNSLREFLETVGQFPAGYPFRMTLVREGKRQEAVVTLGEREYSGVKLAKDPLIEAVKSQIDSLQKTHKDMQQRMESTKSPDEADGLRQELGKLEATLNSTIARYAELTRFLPPTVKSEQTEFGVVTTDLTEQLGAFFGTPYGGVLVNSVVPGGLAERTGIQAGDIIVTVKGQKTPNRSQFFQMLVAGVSPSDPITIVRHKKPVKLKLAEKQ